MPAVNAYSDRDQHPCIISILGAKKVKANCSLMYLNRETKGHFPMDAGPWQRSAGAGSQVTQHSAGASKWVSSCVNWPASVLHLTPSPTTAFEVVALVIHDGQNVWALPSLHVF